MSHGPESKESVKRRNAQPDRRMTHNARACLLQKKYPEATQARHRKSGVKRGIYAQMIDDQRNPIIIELENVAITSDWHVPFTDEPLIQRLFDAAEEHDTRDLIIAGDFWDCDNYSRFTHMTVTASFQEEIEEVKKEIRRLLQHFDRIIICRGNHEKRWCDLNAGKVNMVELFRLAYPGDFDAAVDEGKIVITLDDHIHLIHHSQLWLICHPKNFRIVPLSVAQDLAAKNLCNVITAHGHTFRQGRDRSGQFRIAEGGGMFDRFSLDYLRDTTCHPMTRSGFYILKDNVLIPFEGSA